MKTSTLDRIDYSCFMEERIKTNRGFHISLVISLWVLAYICRAMNTQDFSSTYQQLCSQYWRIKLSLSLIAFVAFHEQNVLWFHESNNWSRAQCSSQIRKGYSEKQVMSGFLPSIDNNLQHSKVFVDPMVILLGEKESWSGVMWFVCYPSFPWIQSQCPPFLPARFQIVKD